jgi:pantoate--beta-alanine ligase
MQALSQQIRLAGRSIGLVPTMGFFHEGHLELMRVARRHADTVVVSIFVNPTQFGAGEDLNAYPRDMEGDLTQADAVGVDHVFVPTAGDMYPEGFQTRVCVDDLTRFLCGPSRPGHFDGVATVVAKLFLITRPHLAVFGQKDYQQLAVISRMARDLNMDIQIIGVPTVREPDGLAMSSRNSYLSPEERKAALCLNASLALAQDMVRAGETEAAVVLKAVEQHIRQEPLAHMDYAHLCDPVTLEDLQNVKEESLLALAVIVGKARLIDNRVLVRESPSSR